MSPCAEIYFEDKKFVSLKKASEASGYAKDYIGQLCRGGKINSRRVGREWFVDCEDLVSYQNKKQTQEWAGAIREKADFFSKNDSAEADTPARDNSVSAFNFGYALNSVLCLPAPVYAKAPATEKIILNSDSAGSSAGTKKNKKSLPHFFETFAAAAIFFITFFYLVVNGNQTAKLFVYEKIDTVAQSISAEQSYISAVADYFNMAKIKKISAEAASSVGKAISKIYEKAEKLAALIGEDVFFLAGNFQNFATGAGEKTFSFFGGAGDTMKNFALDRKKDDYKKIATDTKGLGPPNDLGPPSSSGPPEEDGILENQNGLIVIPAKETESENESAKKKIKDSFSDEVEVMEDGTGEAGIIKPKFKKSEGEDYLYVLVPIDKK